MKVFVCSRSKVSKMTSKVGASHVLSLCDYGKRPWLHPKTPMANRRLFLFEDVIDPTYDRAPKKEQIQDILDWAKSLPEDAVVLVHCEAGISRSTAVALALLVQHHGKENLSRCVDLLFGVRPEASPNPLILKYADDLLGCNGLLLEAGEKLTQSKLLRAFWK